jgi:hypothetical protein
MRTALTILLLTLLVSCSAAKKRMYPIQKMRGTDGAWQHVISGKEVQISCEGRNVRIQHGGHYIVLLNVTDEFRGNYTFYTVEIRSDSFNAFYSPKGLTVRYKDKLQHWEPEDLPTGVKIVVYGVDLRYEGLETDT